MKKISLFLTISVVCFLVFNVPASADKIKDFDVLANGNVVVNGTMVFKNMGEYMSSKFFKENGARCLLKPSKKKAVSSQLDSIMAVPSDCDNSQTVIQAEYWPDDAYTIPIVFHVIYKADGTGNIPDSRIINQVAVMNEDYGAIAGTLGELGFDCKIQFELAGITRTENDKWFRDRGVEQTYKTALAWDVNNYMNVYVNSASGYLGYSYLPQDAAGEWWDGVVLLYSACGGRDEGIAGYDQGRTLVHEAGHYLGLLHTFEGCVDGYTGGDLIDDTPMENTAHYECVQTYTCDTPDPIHNYMNYTYDICMYQFTPEQGNRLVCSLVNYRPDLSGGGVVDPEADMYLYDIGMTTTRAGSKYYATATITIRDTDNLAVEGATVHVTWSGSVSGTASGATGSDGTVAIVSPRLKGTGLTFTVTVTDVTHPNRTYDPSQNVVSNTATITN